MSLGGELATLDFFDLMQWVMSRCKTGLLQVTRLSTRKRFGFRDGTLQSTGSNDPRETIGQRLVREGLIDEETLFRALLKQEEEKSRARLGEILVRDGLLSEGSIRHALCLAAEAQILDVFLWPDGRFDFDESQAAPASPSDLGIDLRPLLEEGRHRRELWVRLRRQFPSNRLTFRLAVDTVSLSDPALRRIVGLAALGRTLAAISLETRRSEYETTLLLSDLVEQGVLAPDRVEAESTTSDPVGSILTLLASAESRLKEGRYDDALEAYEAVLALDGVNQAAKKGLLAVAEARQNAKLARLVPLEKVPRLRLTAVTLAQQRFRPEEGFVLSRINGEWDVRSILKLCPMTEDEILAIFARLLERNVIELR
ncbi:MAG TPA: DUF4388 domain-containing protein [Vicinamibacteria bacterium]|nr:DUF4388 domain-containing protein [Vicinamibacteria bacterium]